MQLVINESLIYGSADINILIICLQKNKMPRLLHGLFLKVLLKNSILLKGVICHFQNDDYF